jgi:hypothetical protein
MAFSPAGYRITVENTVGVSGKGVNVLWVGAMAGALTDAQLNQCLTDIKALYTAAAPYLGGTYNIGARVLEYLAGGSAPLIRNVTALSQAGAGGTFLPAQCAAVVSWRTAFAGPAYRGRTFLGPLLTTAVTGPSLSAAFLTAVNAAVPTMITNLASHVGGLGGLMVRSQAKTTDSYVQSGNMNSKVDTLRSRA